MNSDKHLHLRCNEEQHDMLAALSKEYGLNMTQTIWQLVREAYEKECKK